jgi:rhamnose utilization protein RhaD (predicted bifunctional aldolase and dehydrogenase)
MNEITDFVKYSKYAGQRFDLVQAGGGNSSVKLENVTMDPLAFH